MKVDRVRVGDVLALQRRVVNVEPDAIYTEIGIRSFARGIFHKEPFSGFNLGAKRVFYIEPGDLVISNVFAWEGAVALATVAESGMIGSHRFMTFTPTDGRINTAWAAWFFISEPGLELIRLASPGSAGRNRTLAIDRFESLEIPLRPINEQRSVAAKLDRLSQVVEAVSARSTRAHELTEAFIASTVTRPDLGSSAKVAAGWRRVPLGEVMTAISNDEAVDPAKQYAIAGIYSFGRGLIDRGTIVGSETSYRTFTLLSENDVVISKLGDWEGAIAVVPKKFAGHHVSGEYPIFSVDRQRLLPAFFEGVTRSLLFWELLDANTRGSMARRRRVNVSDFLEIRIWLPPFRIQTHLAQHLHQFDKIIESYNRTRRR